MKTVVVVGAGMVGTGTALALQARGFDVMLLDRTGPGSETSYGNAGVIQGEACEPYSMPRDIKALCRIALKDDNSVDWDLPGLWRSAPSLFSYWRHSAPARHENIGREYSVLAQRATRDHAKWIAASGSEALIRRDGYRVAFRNPASFELQTRKAERLRDLYGVEFESEDSERLGAAEPALRQPLAGAIHWRDAWTCSDPGALVQAYSKLFTEQGGALLKAELVSLGQTGAGWKLQSTDGQVDTAQVVIALGPWSPQPLAPLGYKVEMIPKRGYHKHFAYPAAEGALRLNLPLLDAAFGAVYSPMRSGLRVATGADLSALCQVRPRQLQRAEAAAREILDFGAPVESSVWCGIRPCMPDMVPVVGAAPHHSGLWFNFGHGHQGFTLGPTTGEVLAELMSGGPHIAPTLEPARLFR